MKLKANGHNQHEYANIGSTKPVLNHDLRNKKPLQLGGAQIILVHV